MLRPPRTSWLLLSALMLFVSCGGGDAPAGDGPAVTATHEAVGPAPMRLYILDCGTLVIADAGRFSLMPDETSTLELSVPCYLIEHPEGLLLWDAGLPDEWAARSPFAQENGTLTTVERTLAGQLEELRITPADIDYLAMSHMHYDHSGNANMFAGSEWLVQRPQHEAAFGEAGGFFDRSLYGDLETAETRILDGDHDVFGDGTVVIKSAPGHTPGHQVLFVNLVEPGPLVLSGDLYHFPENRQLKRVPLFNFNKAQTLDSMDLIEDFMSEVGARMWIQHDSAAYALLRKSPDYYQ